MQYFTYRRFKGIGIDGYFNLPYGTIVEECNGILMSSDSRRICVTTSENGWEHFHANTYEAKKRQQMLEYLYTYYKKSGTFYDDFDVSTFQPQENTYWKNILRTLPQDSLKILYTSKMGGVNHDS